MPIAVNDNVDKDTLGRPFSLAKSTRERLVQAGIDLSKGYPEYPIRPKTIELASDIRKEVGIVFFFFAFGMGIAI